MKYLQRYMIGIVLLVSFIHVSGKDSFISHCNDIYQQQHGEVTYAILEERLWTYYQNPIDLNNTTREELEELCILTSSQID